jgi:hypothetical protein
MLARYDGKLDASPVRLGKALQVDGEADNVQKAMNWILFSSPLSAPFFKESKKCAPEDPTRRVENAAPTGTARSVCLTD